MANTGTVLVECEHCGVRSRVPPAAIGRLIACHSCGEKVELRPVDQRPVTVTASVPDGNDRPDHPEPREDVRGASHPAFRFVRSLGCVGVGIAAAAILCGGVMTVGGIAKLARRQPPPPSPAQQVTAVPAAPAATTPVLSVQILRQRYEPFRTAQGQNTHMLCVDWVNNGNRPIRSLFATLRALDADGNRLGTIVTDYCIFAVSNDAPGVFPGEQYVTPDDQGKIVSVLTASFPTARQIEVVITRAEETGY